MDRSDGRPGSRGGDGGISFPGFPTALGAAVVSAKVSQTVHSIPAQRTKRKNGREHFVACCLPVSHTTGTLHYITPHIHSINSTHTVVGLLYRPTAVDVL